MTKKGIESLKEVVIADTVDRGRKETCFNEKGCTDDNPNCSGKNNHRFCDKYAWVIERAKHYADRLGSTPEEVIQKWETNRSYWYMNYYQDGNQPLLDSKEGRVKIWQSLDEWRAALVERFGDDPSKWAFKCARCGNIQTVEEFKAVGGDVNDAFFSCIGRFKKGKGCDWTLGGLFSIHKEVVINEDMKAIPVFEMAEGSTK